MSQESVNEVTNNPSQPTRTPEEVLRQMSTNVAQLMGMFGEMNERVQRLEEARSAPPNLEALHPPQQEAPPPPQFQPQQAWPPLVPPPIPPFRGGYGTRGRGRGDPRARLHEQEVGGQAYYPRREEAFEEDYGGDENEPFEDRYRPRPPPRPYNPRGRFHEEEEEFKDIKINIPSFCGTREPEVYLEWERKVVMAFEYRDCSERKKLKLILQEFSGYALTWWDGLTRKRLKDREDPIDTWDTLRREMRKRFVPDNYERDLYQKLQWLVQGSKSVEAYYEEMQTLMLRAELEEHEEAVMARFSRGLNRDIYNIVELQSYHTLEELLDKATRVERQLRASRFKSASTSSTPYQRTNWNKGEEAPKRPFEAPRVTRAEPNPTKPPNRPPPNPWPVHPLTTQQSKFPSSSAPRTRDVTCFKCKGKGHYARECPNKRVLIINEVGKYDSASEGECDTEEATKPPMAETHQESEGEMMEEK